MSDDYRIIEQQVGDWHCAVRYRLVAEGTYDVRWWVVENQGTGRAYSWVCCEPGRGGEPPGHYPKLLVQEDGKVKFFMPDPISEEDKKRRDDNFARMKETHELMYGRVSQERR